MKRAACTALSLLLIASASVAQNKPRQLKPGFNLFSKEQDVQVGKEAAAEVEKQMEIVKNDQLQAYVRKLGTRLWSQPEADKYPYEIRAVNESAINAFALPGGQMFVHTGLITAADNEGQLAGVLAHEISHVALRHGTNQVSKANLIQLPAMLAGSLAGQSIWGQLTQLGIGIGANSLLLKYSRNAERDADLLGTRILAKAGYDPVEMARFFEKLEAESGSGRGLQFFSSHPNPGNRVKAVQAEIQLLPPPRPSPETGQFAQAKEIVKKLPAPKKVPQAAPGSGQPSGDIKPSARFTEYRGGFFTVSRPENWEAFPSQDGKSVTIAPRAGIVQDQGGQVAIGAGFLVNQRDASSGRVDLRRDTDALIKEIVASNRDMKLEQSSSSRWNGEEVIITRLTSPSPLKGETEIDTVMTFARSSGLVFIIMVTPQSAERDLQPAFDTMLRSLQLPR